MSRIFAAPWNYLLCFYISGDQHVRQEKLKSKMPSSSLVARSMGSEGLKFKQPIYRQHKSFVELDLQKTLPVARQEELHLVDRKSYRKRHTKPSEYRDVFEAMSSSKSHEFRKNPESSGKYDQGEQFLPFFLVNMCANMIVLVWFNCLCTREWVFLYACLTSL